MITIKNRNKTICYVDRIRSYQTMIGERVIVRGKFGFSQKYQKKEYKDYQEELKEGLIKLTPITTEIPLKAIITFNLKEGVDLPTYYVKMKSTNNTSRKFNTKEEALEFMNEDKHYLDFEDYEIKYGKGDEDNLTKPIYDTMSDLKIIVDDRYIVDSHKKFTYNNREESIEIELREMEVVVKDDGQYVFR